VTTYTEIDNEVWKPVSGFDGYFVSDLGRIKSERKGKPSIRKAEIDKDGYSRLTLRKNGADIHVVVSRIVCMAFHGEPPSGDFVCCHKDGNKSNNKAENLRGDTQKGNIQDKVVHGTHQIGSKHPRAEITESDAILVKKALSSYVGTRGKLLSAVQKTGVSYHIVADISKGRTWGHV
jgi:hypothetical protein